MQYHAILFMCDDINRAEWVSEEFKRHNPDISLTVYNGGVDNVDVRGRVKADRYEAGDNLWHWGTRCGKGSFGFGWFEKFYGLAQELDADHTIYLETDVEVRRGIESPPSWDISGVMNGADAAASLIAYDYWGSYLKRAEFDEHVNPTPNKIHTGAGGTAFSRNFFTKTLPHLPLVKEAFEKIPYVFYADLMISLLARHSHCPMGDWSQVSDVHGSYRFDEQENRIFYEPGSTDTPMIHGVKIRQS